jgi:RNA polymerase sigma factor (sigma-70 family)
MRLSYPTRVLDGILLLASTTLCFLPESTCAFYTQRPSAAFTPVRQERAVAFSFLDVNVKLNMNMIATDKKVEEETFLEDGDGHINPELADRIWNWEHAQREGKNLPKFPYSTRQGLRLVNTIVHELTGRDNNSDESDDLIQEGVIALMKVMKDFDTTNAPPGTFEAHAKAYIRQQLVLSLDSSKPSNKNRKKMLSMETTVEIADPIAETRYSNQDEWEVREGLVLDNGLRVVKRDESVEEFIDESMQYEGEDQMWVHQKQVVAPLRDSIPDDIHGSDPSPDDLALTDMIRYDVDEFLGTTLNEMESMVIQMRFGLDSDIGMPQTQKEVAVALGLSVKRVRKLQQEALEKLRQAYSDRYVEMADDDHYWEDSV